MTVVKAAPEQITKQETGIVEIKPALNLSIDDLPIAHQIHDDDFLNTVKEPKEKNNTLLKTLSKNRTESSITFSGKLFMDEDKFDNEEYLDSIDGLQINIEGKFN